MKHLPQMLQFFDAATLQRALTRDSVSAAHAMNSNAATRQPVGGGGLKSSKSAGDVAVSGFDILFPMQFSP